MENNNKIIKNYLKKIGIVISGVADISKLKEEFIFDDRKILDDLNFGISIGMPLLSGILETIKDHPTQLYFHHYRQTNNIIDKITHDVALLIQSKGYKAIPIPASQIIDWKKQLAQVSHRSVAFNAGLGWWGRNNLLVNPVYGSQARYATILTNYPLDTGSPLKTGCGDCYKCISVCPISAIEKDSRNFKREDCLGKLKEFAKIPGIGQFICGICVKVCDGKGMEQRKKKGIHGQRKK
ncbi:MAG: hypothetical protein PHX78_00745 [bacterium]|nr:hypothetical protein [bacterium]